MDLAIERDERGRDLLGFIEERCPHCSAHYYLADDPNARPLCLNACLLPTHLYRTMIQGLTEAAQRIKAKQ